MKFKPFDLLKIFRKKKADNLQERINRAKPFEASYKEGLNSEQVKARIDANLINKQKNKVSMNYFQLVLKDVFTVLNILLITIAVVMMVFGLWMRLFFVLILTLNIGISIFQDIKAKYLVNKLSLISNPRATVIRNSTRLDIPFDEVVLSDIILLKAGHTVPCDAIVVYGSIRVNESFLSGETDAVLKQEKDKVFAQSYVTSGTAYARVFRIAGANYANCLQEKARSFIRPKSEILKSLNSIIRVISIGAVIIGIAEIITYSVTGQFSGNPVPGVDSITSSLVAMIPTGMYLMTSITLTVGVIVLARHRMLVRELYSIEMLARVNIVCVDKTGTLTDGNMVVKDLITIGGIDKTYVEKIISQILYITKDENLTARALRDRYATKKIKGNCSSIPFDSDKKYSAASFNGHTYVMGAYGFVKITNDKAVKSLVTHYEKQGKRVLLIAEGNKNIVKNTLPNSLKAIGIVVLVEQLKKDAKANIEWFKNNDVSLRIISGDSANSLKSIALDAGLEDANKVISLEGLNDNEVAEAANEYRIFARVTPEQKKIIIASLRQQGNTVAMIGDGVNDILALKQADCSIAMANGADAAKSVAHLVSLDSNFSALPKVVEEGRRVINNLQRVCSIFLVKTIFAFFMATLFLILSWITPDVQYPFSTNNLMAWEILTIALAPFFIALEPNKERINQGFIRNIVQEAIPGAFIQIFGSIPLLLTAYVNPELFPPGGAITMCVMFFSLMSVVILLHVCLPLNRYRLVVLLGTVAAMVIFITSDVLINVVVKGHNVLAVNYLAVNNGCLLLGLLMFIVSIPLYFIAAKYFKVFLFRRKGQKDG